MPPSLTAIQPSSPLVLLCAAETNLQRFSLVGRRRDVTGLDTRAPRRALSRPLHFPALSRSLHYQTQQCGLFLLLSTTRCEECKQQPSFKYSKYVPNNTIGQSVLMGGINPPARRGDVTQK